MNCKYKLPCNWCEKFDKQCTECESDKCDHDWTSDLTYVIHPDNKMPVYKEVFVCRKCGKTEIVDASYISY